MGMKELIDELRARRERAHQVLMNCLKSCSEEALDQPIGTVKSNVHRGLKLLRGEDHDRLDD